MWRSIQARLDRCLEAGLPALPGSGDFRVAMGMHGGRQPGYHQVNRCITARGSIGAAHLRESIHGHYNHCRNGLDMTQLSLPQEKCIALRAQAHKLDPVVLLGAAGLSEAALKEVDRALSAHGLIKVRAGKTDRDDLDYLYQTMAERLGAARIQAIGHTLVLFRPIPEDAPRAAAPRTGAPAKKVAKKAAKKTARAGAGRPTGNPPRPRKGERARPAPARQR
jgi:RNA-binding protein